MPEPERPQTVVEALATWAGQSADRTALTFLADGEHESDRLSFGELHNRVCEVAELLGEQAGPGDRVLLSCPHGVHFVVGLLACMAVGAVPVPAYPPNVTRADHSATRLAAIARDCRPRVVLTTASYLTPTAAVLDAGLNPRWLTLDRLENLAAGGTAGHYPGGRGEFSDVPRPRPRPGDVALLQYTSGSTAEPRGVMVTHENLVVNCGAIAARTSGAGDVGVSWLPLFHDMGLIGVVLSSVLFGKHVVLMPPEAFLRRPVRWLRAITRYQAGLSVGPNVGYEMCLRIPEPDRAGLDLSSWRYAGNGSELVRGSTLEQFATAFGPYGLSPGALCPTYGLAEATLMVSMSDVGRRATVLHLRREALREGRAVAEAVAEADGGPGTQAVVGCGRVNPGTDVVIADPDTGTALGEAEVGEILVAGRAVASGYWQRPLETAQTFQNAGPDGRGGYLRTGDLGFRHNGELFVVGRVKELIVIDGRNHHPCDLEATAELSHPALRRGCIAAFAVDGGDRERFAVVAEVDARKVAASQSTVLEVDGAVRAALAREHGVAPGDIVLIEPRTIPKTSSGKLQRHRCRQALADGTLRRVDLLGQFGQAAGGAP